MALVNCAHLSNFLCSYLLTTWFKRLCHKKWFVMPQKMILRNAFNGWVFSPLKKSLFIFVLLCTLNFLIFSLLRTKKCCYYWYMLYPSKKSVAPWLNIDIIFVCFALFFIFLWEIEKKLQYFRTKIIYIYILPQCDKPFDRVMYMTLK